MTEGTKVRNAETAPTLKSAVPILRMFDVSKAREFYLGYLGFTVDFEHRFSENAPLFMGISRGDIVLFLSEHHGDGTPGTHVLIETDGVDAFLAELKAKNYRYMNPGIQVQDWGRRDLVVVDPFDNHINFSEQIE